ncbi:hypothetical protein [Azospirillum argentinense]
MAKANTRGPNLTGANLDRIVKAIDLLPDPISWNAVVETVRGVMGHEYTRQALNKHERIRTAFDARKRSAGSPAAKAADSPQGMTLRQAQQRIAKLEAENARLRLENERFLEKFSRWSYHAFSANLDEEFLDRPLPPVNREPTKGAPR